MWGHLWYRLGEIAALYNLPLAELIALLETEVQSDFNVEIDDPDRCPRYIGVEMSGVNVKERYTRCRIESEGWYASNQCIG